MITFTTNPDHAALRALGVDPLSNTTHLARTRLREALENRNLNPFRLGTVTAIAVMPAIAAVTLMRHFNGTAVPWVGVETEEPTFEGFHRRAPNSNLFHQDSADFEDDYLVVQEQSAALSARLASAGVNVVECMQPRTLGEPTSLLLSGTVLDFYELRYAIGGPNMGSHLDASDFAFRVWDQIHKAYPLTSGAIVEYGL